MHFNTTVCVSVACDVVLYVRTMLDDIVFLTKMGFPSPSFKGSMSSISKHLLLNNSIFSYPLYFDQVFNYLTVPRHYPEHRFQLDLTDNL